MRGHFNKSGTRLTSVGLTCAVCHSIVDDLFTKGIGKRLDGWANRDLNVGAIVSLSPNLKPVADVLATGWGTVTYWNAFVANLEMHGEGNFTDARLDDANRFPVAARNRFGHVRHKVDRISSKLPALHYYQLALPAPKPPSNSYNHAAAARGKKVFDGQGKCASCHTPPTFTEPGWNLHTPQEICTDSFQADRSPTGMYRTTPLRGLWTHVKGGFYHDGRFPTLGAVVDHYNSCMNLGLSGGQKSDLVQYLKSL